MYEMLKQTCPFCGGKLAYQSVSFNHEIATEVEVECGRCRTEFKMHSDDYYITSIPGKRDQYTCPGKDALEKWNEVSALYEKSTEKSGN